MTESIGTALHRATKRDFQVTRPTVLSSAAGTDAAQVDDSILAFEQFFQGDFEWNSGSDLGKYGGNVKETWGNFEGRD